MTEHSYGPECFGGTDYPDPAEVVRPRPERWEDQPSATNDFDALRAEFKERLRGPQTSTLSPNVAPCGSVDCKCGDDSHQALMQAQPAAQVRADGPECGDSECQLCPTHSERAEIDKRLARKARPLFRGVLAYFPDAVAEVAHVSLVANEQHNPGQPMHWAHGKSMDHGDCILRHQADYEDTDEDDGLLHAAKVAWRALAQLQTLLEQRDPALHAKRQAQRDRAAKGER